MHGTSFNLKSMSIFPTHLFSNCKGRLQEDQTRVLPLTTLVWFNWWVSFAPDFQCCYFCESVCLFYLSFNSDFYVSKIMHL